MPTSLVARQLYLPSPSPLVPTVTTYHDRLSPSRDTPSLSQLYERGVGLEAEQVRLVSSPGARMAD